MSKLPENEQKSDISYALYHMITLEKFEKDAKYYNGLKTTIERFEDSKQDFLWNAAFLHKTSIDQLLIDLNGLAPNFHSDRIKDVTADYQLPEKASQYCKRATKLVKAVKLKLDDLTLNEEEESVTGGLLPSEHLLDDEDDNTTLTKYAKLYDGINTTINLLRIRLDNHVDDLSKSTNMEPQLIINLLKLKSQNFHDDILKLVDKGLIKMPADFKSYCRNAQKLVVGLDEDNLDLDTNVFKKACPFSLEDNVQTVDIMGENNSDQ